MVYSTPSVPWSINLGFISPLIGSLSVGLPVALYFILGDRSQQMLGSLKDWLGRNNTTIMAVICLVLGFKLIGAVISGLT